MENEIFDESENWFDIREYGFYEKFGGMNQFLSLALKLRIQPRGVYITKNDLGLLLYEHNEQHPDQKMMIDETGVRLSGDMKVRRSELPISPLEEALLSLDEAYEKSQAFQEIRQQLTRKERSTLSERCLAVMRRGGYNSNDLSFASDLLQQMINHRVDPFTPQSIVAFVQSARNFFLKYRTHDLTHVTERFFSYMGCVSNKKFNSSASECLHEIVQEIIGSLKNTQEFESPLAMAKKRAEFDRKFFFTFKHIVEVGRSMAYMRSAAWHYLQDLQVEYKLVKGLSEKKQIIDEALNFCSLVLDKDTKKDAVMYGNTHYFTAYFNSEKYILIKDIKYRIEAEKYYDRARADLDSIRNPQLRKILEERLVFLVKEVK